MSRLMKLPKDDAAVLSKRWTEGVLLKRAPAFAATRPEEVFGVLTYRGKPKTLEEMDASVLAEARRRHDRD